MKVIIPENRLEQILFKYLDVKLKDLEQLKGRFYPKIFKLPNEEFGIMGKEGKRLLVNYKFTNKILSFIPIKKTEILKIIGRYVEDRYNLEVKKVTESHDTHLVKKLEPINPEPENRLEEIIFKYLDVKFKDLEQVKGSTNFDEYVDVFFRFPGEKDAILVWHKNRYGAKGYLSIYKKVIGNIRSFIPIERDEIRKIIGKYVENRYNLAVQDTTEGVYM
jgi:septum formation topological specificity factor MinE